MLKVRKRRWRNWASTNPRNGLPFLSPPQMHIHTYTPALACKLMTHALKLIFRNRFKFFCFHSVVQSVWLVSYVRDMEIFRNFCLSKLTHSLNKNLLNDYYGWDDRDTAMNQIIIHSHGARNFKGKGLGGRYLRWDV